MGSELCSIWGGLAGCEWTMFWLDIPNAFLASVDLCTGVCHFKTVHQVCLRQLVLRTQSQIQLLCVCVRSVWHNSWLNYTQMFPSVCTHVPDVYWTALLIVIWYLIGGRDSEAHLLRTEATLGQHIWTVRCSILSPVEGLSHSMPHLPLMDSRCPQASGHSLHRTCQMSTSCLAGSWRPNINDKHRHIKRIIYSVLSTRLTENPH